MPERAFRLQAVHWGCELQHVLGCAPRCWTVCYREPWGMHQGVHQAMHQALFCGVLCLALNHARGEISKKERCLCLWNLQLLLTQAGGWVNGTTSCSAEAEFPWLPSPSCSSQSPQARPLLAGSRLLAEAPFLWQPPTAPRQPETKPRAAAARAAQAAVP